MNFYKHRDSAVQLNITPLIDVVLLLVIFFMVSTSFNVQRVLDIRLPEARWGENGTDDQLVLSITQDGQFIVAGHAPTTERTVLLKTLSSARTDHPASSLRLVGDKLSPHQALVTALEVAGQVGFDGVEIETQLEAYEG